ncbi:MAG: hypothetical protein HYV65_00065 [Candidatus Spechtbacteria bacterium]|nr:hypothetical protein [Candidatus Spechtbacteria bacterium]
MSFLKSFSFPSIHTPFQFSLDLGIVVFGLIALFLYCMSIGRKRITVLLLSGYIARVVFQVLPFDVSAKVYSFNTNFFSWIMGLLFLILVAIIYFLLAGSALRMALRLPNNGDASWWHIILLSLITSGFFMATLLHLMTDGTALSSTVKMAFFSPYALFGWTVAPIIAIALVRRGGTE